MHRKIIGSVQLFALKLVHQDSDRAIVFGARQAARVMLASQQPALPIAEIAVAVVRRAAENAHLARIFQPPQDAIVGDVAEQEISPVSKPNRPFGPARARVQALDCGIRDSIFSEARIDNFHSGIRIDNWCFSVLLRGQGNWFACQSGRRARSDVQKGASFHRHSPVQQFCSTHSIRSGKGLEPLLRCNCG